MGDFSESDPSSYSNPNECVVKDINLNLEVNFEKKVLSGFVDLTVERDNSKADLVLDTHDLVIHSVKNKNTMKKFNFVLGDADEQFGSKLEVKLPKSSTKKYILRIDYETSPNAGALQWLEASQTAGKRHPYMFSQCQSIFARSLVPCQDTPSVKATYSAKITAPYELTVLMSAIRDGEEIDADPLMKTFKFVQKIPIPSYLLAIVVGELESREIGPRSHVWCEKEFVEKAAEEFSQTETFLAMAEELAGPYVWQTYDLLVLPPSFSFGGMENPCLTFVTPTLLAGDKSLCGTVAHEIAHSWTGNLVTQHNYQHFWLNEGFTMFLERKLIGRLEGEAHRHFEALQGWKELQYGVDTLGKTNPLTKLVPDLKGVSPEDAFSIIPYEKGHTLLFHLETLLGGKEVFEKYVRQYIEDYKHQSLTTHEWKDHLYRHFSDQADVLDRVDWEAWLYGTGMPPLKPKYDASLQEKCTSLCQKWVKATELDTFTSDDLKDFSSSQKIEFLALLLQESPLPVPKLQKMKQVYCFGKISNAELRFRWIKLGLMSHWKEIVPDAIQFVTEQGRLKFVRPIYRELYKWEENRDLAMSTYQEHLPQMMKPTAHAVAKDLKIDKELS